MKYIKSKVELTDYNRKKLEKTWMESELDQARKRMKGLNEWFVPIYREAEQGKMSAPLQEVALYTLKDEKFDIVNHLRKAFEYAIKINKNIDKEIAEIKKKAKFPSGINYQFRMSDGVVLDLRKYRTKLYCDVYTKNIMKLSGRDL